MEQSLTSFQIAVRDVADAWLSSGLPSREGLEDAAGKLARLRKRSSIPGIWEHPPTLATATLDDGLGQGLAVIEAFAGAIGMQVNRLGLMLTKEAIVEDCRCCRPDFLGLTVLQFDTEDDLRFISARLARKIRIVAGGPVFNADPDFAERTGTHYAAKNVAHFLLFMLDTATEKNK
jgi:methylmalonyl-CoA mutase cobalamin-binding subunit